MPSNTHHDRNLERVDSIYRLLVDWTWNHCGWGLEIVSCAATAVGFQVQSHRGIVERTFAWLGRYRRPSKDYETPTESREAHLKIAMTHLMLQRITRRQLSWQTSDNFSNTL